MPPRTAVAGRIPHSFTWSGAKFSAGGLRREVPHIALPIPLEAFGRGGALEPFGHQRRLPIAGVPLAHAVTRGGFRSPGIPLERAVTRGGSSGPASACGHSRGGRWSRRPDQKQAPRNDRACRMPRRRELRHRIDRSSGAEAPAWNMAPGAADMSPGRARREPLCAPRRIHAARPRQFRRAGPPATRPSALPAFAASAPLDRPKCLAYLGDLERPNRRKLVLPRRRSSWFGSAGTGRSARRVR
jgi:hypothetical protein